MGSLTVTAVAEDQVEDGERLSFNPWRLVPGIEAGEDPILALRRGAYEFSRERRGGICPFSGG
jgi:catalase